MILNGKNGRFQINKDGSYFFNGINYFSTNPQKSKKLAQKLQIIYKKDEIDFDSIDEFYAQQIYNDLMSIVNNSYIEPKERKAFLDNVKGFGFHDPKEIENLKKEYYRKLQEVGFTKFDYTLEKSALRLPNDEALNQFITHFKENNNKDFSLFSETVQELGVAKEDVFSLYNDKIDESFSLKSEEYKIFNESKKHFFELQERFMGDLQKYGLEVPASLPRLIAPSNKFKDIALNPQKEKMIREFDFNLWNKLGDYKSPYFNDDGTVRDEQREELAKRSKNGLVKLNIDTNNSTDFITAQILKNGGFDYDEFKKWAMATDNNGVNNVSDAYLAINNGLLHCNKLVEAGILVNTQEGKYEFASPSCRDILFENMDADYIELSNKVIEKHNITFDATKKMAEEEEGIIKGQKINFFEYLDSQYESYYKPQNLSLDDFYKDLLHTNNGKLNKEVNSEELNYCKNMFPKYFNSVDSFENVADEYLKYKSVEVVYTREDYSFSENDNIQVKEKFKELQAKNRSKNSQEDDKLQFRDIALIKFGGALNDNFNKYREYSLKNGKDEQNINTYIKNLTNRASELVEAGLMTQKDKDYIFVDDRAKKTLLDNLGKDKKELDTLNRGVATEIKKETSLKPFEIQKENIKEVISESANTTNVKIDEKPSQNKEQSLKPAVMSDIIQKYENFDFNHKFKRDPKYKELHKKMEDILLFEGIKAYGSDEKFKQYIDSLNLESKGNKNKIAFIEKIKENDNLKEKWDELSKEIPLQKKRKTRLNV